VFLFIAATFYERVVLLSVTLKNCCFPETVVFVSSSSLLTLNFHIAFVLVFSFVLRLDRFIWYG